MLKNLKNKSLGIKNFKPSKLNGILIAIAVGLNALILAVMYWKGTYHANSVFLRANILQMLIISLGSIILFYMSYKEVAKKKAAWTMLLAYIVMVGVNLVVMSGLVYLLEMLLGKAHFSTANALFVSFSLIIFGLLLSRYDFPLIDSGKKFYLATEEHFKKNLGALFFLFFLVAWIGLMNGAIAYVLALIPLLLNLYIFKALLSNLRR